MQIVLVYVIFLVLFLFKLLIFCDCIQKSKAGTNDDDINGDDCSKFTSSGSLMTGKGEEDWFKSFSHLFVPANLSKAFLRNHTSDGTIGSDDDDDDDDDEGGGFEDLETGQKYGGGHADNIDQSSKDDAVGAAERKLKKLALRAKFDAEYPFQNLLFFSIKMSSVIFEVGLVTNRVRVSVVLQLQTS